jgi:hypothetical protein
MVYHRHGQPNRVLPGGFKLMLLTFVTCGSIKLASHIRPMAMAGEPIIRA